MKASFDNMNKKIKVFIGVILLLLVAIISLLVCPILSPINLQQEKINTINISIVLSTPDKTMLGRASISNEEDKKKVVKTLNSIKAGCFAPEIEGDSPSACITIYYNNGDESDSINLYYKALHCPSGQYRVNLSQYDKLGEICKKYGDLEIDQ